MKKTLGVIVLSAAVFGFAGCAGGGSDATCPQAPSLEGPAGESDFDQMERIAMDTTMWAQELIGMSEGAAEKCAVDAGYTWRVTERDGEMFAMTMDYYPTRINVAVENGVVTEAFSG
jgi:hypothetical protein